MEPNELPILVMGFNRPHFVEQLFAELRQLEPRRIYYAVDGPRSDSSDWESVEACQRLASTIDWPCEIHTRFSSVNQGCGFGVSSAITWFFEHEEEGIILEDDIRPDPSFYPFAAQMLDRYRENPQVFAVTGTNFVPRDYISSRSAYRFSRIPIVWGWATWKRSWTQYNYNIRRWYRGWNGKRAFQAMGGSVSSAAFWALHFQLMAAHRIDTWDYQAVYAAMRSNALTVTPNVNLVENVGFQAGATHTERVPRYLLPRGTLPTVGGDVPVVVDEAADRFLQKHIYRLRLRRH